MNKTTRQIFEPRNMLKWQIVLKENTDLIIYGLEKKLLSFFSR